MASEDKGLLAAFSGFETDPPRPILDLTSVFFHHACSLKR
jgi:hypothetical protein